MIQSHRTDIKDWKGMSVSFSAIIGGRWKTSFYAETWFLWGTVRCFGVDSPGTSAWFQFWLRTTRCCLAYSLGLAFCIFLKHVSATASSVELLIWRSLANDTVARPNSRTRLFQTFTARVPTALATQHSMMLVHWPYRLRPTVTISFISRHTKDIVPL